MSSGKTYRTTVKGDQMRTTSEGNLKGPE